MKKFDEYYGKSGVYCIYFHPERRYVGSSVNIGSRIAGHERNLRLGKHILPELQKDYLKHPCLRFEILEYVDDDLFLLERESHWAGKFDLYNFSAYSKDFPEFSDSQLDKFWSLVDKTDDCWIWRGSLTSKTCHYGRICFNQKRYQAHRLSYYLSGKPWLVNSVICHLCNNKQCVNPDHLILGSHATNHRLIVDDGIGCILDKNRANIIREECIYHQGKKYKDLAEIFNKEKGWSLKYYHVRNVIENKSFSDENWDVDSFKVYVASGENSSSAKLNWEIIGFIRDIYLTQKITLQQISDLIQNKFNININSGTVHKIVKNQRWFDENYII